jgi:hypothetical protein
MLGRWLRYALSLPERAVRALVAVLAGLVHESAEVLLPRVVRRSRLYEATAKNALRIAIELVGAVEPKVPQPITAGRLAVRKATGNVAELGSIAAFGFSPLWLLAAAADVLHGTRVYLDSFVAELKRAGVLAPKAEITSVDDLLAALEHTSGRAARLLDIPPLELAELRRTLGEFRGDAASLPGQDDLARLYRGLRLMAAAERRPLLEVSAGIGLAVLLSARSVADEHLAVPYKEDWDPLKNEGFAAYARRVGKPYARAVARHFHPDRPTWTERALPKERR